MIRALAYLCWALVAFYGLRLALPYVMPSLQRGGGDAVEAAAPDSGGLTRIAVTRPPLQLPGGVTALAWSNKGRLLAVAYNSGRNFRVFDAAGHVRQEIQVNLEHNENTLLFLDDGKVLVTPALDSGSDATDAMLCFWDTATGELIRHVPGPRPGETWRANRAVAIAKSGNNEIVAALSGEGADSSVTVFDTAASKPVFSASAKNLTGAGGLASLDITKDGEVLALGSIGRVFVRAVKDPTDSLAIDAFAAPSPPVVAALSFSPAGSLLAAGAGAAPAAAQAAPSADKRPLDHFVGVWALPSGKLREAIAEDLSPVRDLEWSPSGRYLAIAAGDGTVRVWEPEARGSPAPVTVNLSRPVTAVSWLGDDSTLAIAAGAQVELISVNP